jgi:DNA-binding response OmpR family regulator
MSKRSKRVQILLVDDEIDLLLPLAEALHRAGLAPTIATSSDEVLFEIGVSPPDIVLLDADMAGRGLLAALRASISTLPVVLMNSATRHDPTWKAMLATVGVMCIDKPIDVGMLLALLTSSNRFPCSAHVHRSTL